MSEQKDVPVKTTETDGKWRLRVGKRPHTLVAEERPDRGGEVYFRWYEETVIASGEKKGQTKSVARYCATGLYVRDNRGRLRSTKKDEVEKAARGAQAIYAAGGDPKDWAKATTSKSVPKTLKEGFHAALPDLKNPAHVGSLYAVANTQAKHVRSGANYVENHLGSETEWSDLRPYHWVDLWRKMANAHVAGGPGYRTLLRATGALKQVWEHLREVHGDDFPPIQRPANMRKRMKEDWEKITGESLKELRSKRKKELRFTPDELKKIFSNLDAVVEVEVARGRKKNRRTVREMRLACDPRIRTVVEIGAELRQGQVLRAMRSHLVLDKSFGRYGLGRFYGSKCGNDHKPGQDVDLHPELREYIDYVLKDGYLSDLERAYLRGEIDDYPLYPAGKLVNGKIPLWRVEKYPKKHLHPTNAIKRWNEFERRIGITHVDGRAFYGLRRGLTDHAKDLTKDPRVLNNLTGHLDSETREEYYVDQEREEDQGEAAVVRRTMRLTLAGASPVLHTGEESEDSAQPTLDEVLAQLTPEARAVLEKALGKPSAA